MLKILVTCPPMLNLIEEFRPRFIENRASVDTPNVIQTLTEVELQELAPNYDGWIAGDDPVNEAVLAAGSAGRLRAVVKWGVGVDNVDFQAAERHGVQVINTPNMFGNEVADVAMCYLVGLARQTFWVDRMVRDGQWPKPAGRSVKGSVIGLVGYGDIGKNIVSRLLAMGVKIKLYDPFAKEHELPADMTLFTWPEQIGQCDYIIFACSLNPETHHMLNRRVLNECKTGVGIINVARGPLIDEADLVDALDSGSVSAVALDVMEVEPLPLDSQLRKFENCIFGSHNGSNTVEAVTATSHRSIDELFRLLSK